MQAKQIVSLALTIPFLLVASAAEAATATGRITFISSDQHSFLLNNHDEYKVGASRNHAQTRPVQLRSGGACAWPFPFPRTSAMILARRHSRLGA